MSASYHGSASREARVSACLLESPTPRLTPGIWILQMMSSGESEFPSFDNEDFLFITKANVASFVSSYRSHCQLFYDLVRVYNFASVSFANV